MKKTIDNSKKLVEYGLTEAMVDKLSSEQMINLLAFAMEHYNSPELKKMLSVAASMEITNKPGCSILLHNKIATIMQLKNMTPEQVLDVITDYQIHQEEALAAKMVRDIIIHNQQEKLEDRGRMQPERLKQPFQQIW